EVDTGDQVVGLADADFISSISNQWVDWNDGTVRVTGTSDADRVIIKYDNHAYQIEVNGRVTYLPGNYPARFEARIGQGDDYFEDLTSIRYFAWGEVGNDDL